MIMFWLETPVLVGANASLQRSKVLFKTSTFVITNITVDVLTARQKYMPFVSTRMAGNVPRSPLKYPLVRLLQMLKGSGPASQLSSGLTHVETQSRTSRPSALPPDMKVRSGKLVT